MPEAPIEIFQFLESKMASQTGRDIEGHLRRFQQERAAAAHGIEQRSAREPSGQPQNPGGEIFPERRLSLSYAPAALEQRVARSVEIESKVAFCQMTLDGDIGLPRVHTGTAARKPADLIAHRVFDLEGDEIETLERAPDGRDVDPYGVLRLKPFVPRQRVSGAVNIVLVAVAARCHLPQNPARHAAFQIGPVTQGKVTAELDSTPYGMNVFRFQLLQLFCQELFQAAGAGGKKLLHRGW